MIRFVHAFCFALLGLLLLIPVPSFAGEGRSFPCRHFITKDGRTISYQINGDPHGKPVFHIHGLLGSRKEAEIIHEQAWQAGVRLISMDRPGIGDSTYFEDREVLDYPCDVAALADCLLGKNSRFGILAHSGGTPYGCACAVKFPHRITHLAIVAGLPPVHIKNCFEPGSQNNAIKTAANLPKITIAVLNGRVRQLHRNPDKALKNYSSIWAPQDREMVFGRPCGREDVLKSIELVMAQGGEAMQKELSLQYHDWGFDICDIKNVPVSLWYAMEDPLVTPSMGHFFHQKIKGSKIRFTPKDGHVTILINESPRILRKF